MAFARKSRALIKQYIQVRHAQGIHNVDGDKSYKAYMRPEFFDAHITQLGWQQVRTGVIHMYMQVVKKIKDVLTFSPEDN